MYLNQVAQAPLIVNFEQWRIQVPKFKTKDWIDWANEIDTGRSDNATKDLTPEQRFRLLSAYNILPTDVGELRNWVDTPKGTIRVVRVCLQRATIIGKYADKTKPESYEPLPVPEAITSDTIKGILNTVQFPDLVLLAKDLSDTLDKSKPTSTQVQENTPPKNEVDQGDEEEEEESFLIESSKDELIV